MYFYRWNVESVFEKNILSNVQILLALIHHFSPIGKIALLLPNSLEVNVIQKERNEEDGSLTTTAKKINLISKYLRLVDIIIYSYSFITLGITI